MIDDRKRKPHQDDGDDKRRRQEEALDEAVKNTFPAFDPVSVMQSAPPAADRDRYAGQRISGVRALPARVASALKRIPARSY